MTQAACDVRSPELWAAPEAGFRLSPNWSMRGGGSAKRFGSAQNACLTDPSGSQGERRLSRLDMSLVRITQLGRTLMLIGAALAVQLSGGVSAADAQTLTLPEATLAPGSAPGPFDNLRLTLDLSSRATYVEAQDDWTFLQFIGVDAHNVFTGPEGDWGTLVLQGYLTRIDNADPAPPLFDDGDDWEFVYRIFNFNYTGLSRGKLNFRVGHQEIPFGLEHLVNTNGTLRQYIQPQNLGVKADWGAGVNGVFPDFEYEVAVTTGSGNELELNNGTFTVGGRIGTPRDASTVWGLSAFHGEVASAAGPDGFVRRSRLGLDVTHWLGSVGLKGEISGGRDFDTDVINMIGEVNWRTPEENVLLWAQVRSFNRFNGNPTDTRDDAVSTSVGVRYSPDAHWTFSTQFTQDLSRFGNAESSSDVALQVRYRF